MFREAGWHAIRIIALLWFSLCKDEQAIPIILPFKNS
jgi:hypothetical protein